MAAKPTTESFLNLVAKSELLTVDEIKETLRDYKKRGIDPRNVEAVITEMVDTGVLSKWQAKKLYKGKYKGFFLGRYRLQSLLGKGGMSTVYLAEHALMRRRCAIKVLAPKLVNDKSFLERFQREAHAVASLDHPNIVRAYDVDQAVDGGITIHFLVMEYVEGHSLHQHVAKNGPVDPLDLAFFLHQAALGLQHAHDAGFVHRDIKPGNLLLADDNTVKILDLGIARQSDEEEDSLTVTDGAKVLGTVDFLAPEQAIDSHTVDSRADLYSLGCTAYFLLTGRPPFPTGTVAQRLIQHQRSMPEPVGDTRDDVPADLEQIINQMMAKRPEDRFQSASEIAMVLANWLAENATDTWKSHHPGVVESLSRTAEEYTETPASAQLSDSWLPAEAGFAPDSSVEFENVAPSEEEGLAAFLTTLSSDSSGSSVLDDSNDSAPGTAKLGGQTTQQTRSKKKSSRPSEESSTSERHPLILGAAAVVVLAMGLGIAGLLTGSEDSGEGDSANAAADGGAATDAELGQSPEDLGREVLVDSDGDFSTLSAALSFLAAHKDYYNARQGVPLSTVLVASGQTLTESISIDGAEGGFPQGIRIVAEGETPITISPDGDKPALQLSNVEGLSFEGFEIDAAGKDVAVIVRGRNPSTSFRSIKVHNFQQVGLDLQSAGGFVSDELTFAKIEISSDDPRAVGIRIDAASDESSRLRIENSSFHGAMRAGIEITGETSYIQFRQLVFANQGIGIRIDGAPTRLRDVVFAGNTFFKVERGIVFSSLPDTSTSGLGFYCNLFAGISGPELMFESAPDHRVFQTMLNTDGGGIEQNWSDRDLKATATPGEFNLCIRENVERVDHVNFVSTDPSHPQYLAPQPGSPYARIAPSRHFSETYVGAVSP